MSKCRFYPDATACPLPNVHCSAPACFEPNPDPAPVAAGACKGSATGEPADCAGQGCINANRCLFPDPVAAGEWEILHPEPNQWAVGRREAFGHFLYFRSGSEAIWWNDRLNTLEHDHAAVEALRTALEEIGKTLDSMTSTAGEYQDMWAEATEELETLRAKAALADEVVSELKAREKMSGVDALLFWRLTDYERTLVDRYDVLASLPTPAPERPA